MSNGFITRWQGDKLLAGKYRGFFLDGYKIVGHLGKDCSSTTYLAEVLETSEQVGLCFSLPLKPPRKGERMKYDVVEVERSA